MNLEEISRIVALMEDHGLTEFTVECDDLKLVLKRDSSQGVPVETGVPVVHVATPSAQAVVTAPPAGAPVAVPAPEVAESAAAEPEFETIQAPIVGTFYRAPAPDSPPFVKEGDEIQEDTVVCIIEAMKVMNEIQAEVRGVVERVLLDSAAPVEYGQPLFEVRPR